MEHAIPQASGKLAEIASSLMRNPSVIVERANEALLLGDTAYAGLPPSIQLDVRDSVEFAAQLWLREVVDGHPPSEEELFIVAESGRRRVRQGVSLASQLHAVRLGSRELWRAILERCADDRDNREQLLMLFSPFLLAFFDSMSLRLASAYVDEQYQHSRWRDALRYELLSVIFGVPSDGAAFQRTAEALGLNPATPRVAIALEVDMHEVLPSRTEGELDRIVLSVSRCLKLPTSDLLRALHMGRVVIWVPTIPGDSVLTTDNLMRAHAKQVIDCTRNVLAVGVGLMNIGPRGWAASLSEAFRALELNLFVGISTGVAAYSDFVLDESVLRSENALRYLNAMIDRISHEQELLQTLSVFFEFDQHRKQTAERLGIHPNTLNYRLGRIEEMLGANLSDISWMSKLHVAIQLRPVSERASGTNPT